MHLSATAQPLIDHFFLTLDHLLFCKTQPNWMQVPYVFLNFYTLKFDCSCKVRSSLPLEVSVNSALVVQIKKTKIYFEADIAKL